NGNTLSRIKDATDQVFYDWDFENRLLRADVTDPSGTRSVDYQYDADGIRVASSSGGRETRYLIDANRPFTDVVEEYAPGGAVTVSYAHGLGRISQDRGGARSFYLYDAHSGVRQLTNPAGAVTDRYSYDAFGNLLGGAGLTANSYLYTGEQFDSGLGLYY